MTMDEKKSDRNVEILIAEDSPTQAAQLVHLLEQHGFVVRAGRNGREALDLLEQSQPALVITDVMMPEMDGFGLCRAIKSDARWKHLPVVLLTTLSDPEDVIRGLECGADNFIRKPYDERYLLSRIDYLLMNVAMRRNQRVQIGVEISLGDHRHFITSERQQILDLLISTYEQAVQINNDLKAREKELGQANHVLNGLYRIAEGLNQASSEAEVLALALERAVLLPGVEAGWILLREGDSTRLAAARNLPAELEEPGAFEGSCACSRLCLSGELDSVRNIVECELLERTVATGQRHHASVPLWLDHAVLGVMNLLGPDDGAFDEASLKMLYNVGNQVALALDRVRLRGHLEELVEEKTAKLEAEIVHRTKMEQELLHRARREAALADLGHRAITSSGLQAFFDEACRVVSETLGSEILTLAERLPDGNLVVRAGTSGIDAPPPEHASQLRYVLASDKPVLVADYAWESRFRPSPLLLDRKIASCVSVAIPGEDAPFGILSAFSNKVAGFPPGSELFARGVADLVAAAVRRTRAEESRRESEALLQIASRLGRVGAWRVDVPEMVLTVSDEVRAIYELDPGAPLTVEEAIDYYAPEYREAISEAFDACMREGVPYDLELQIVTKKGRRVWVRSIGEADRNGSGAIRRVHGAFQDISERKEAAERTRLLAERLTSTLESIADAFITVDHEWRVTYMNPAGERLLQRNRAELLGKVIWDEFPEARGSIFEKEYSRAVEEAVPVEFEAHYEPLQTWAQIRAYPSPQGLTIYAHDVTEQRRGRKAVEESEQRFRLLFNKYPYPTWVYDIETLAFLAVNEAAIRHYGYSQEEFLGMTIRDIRPPEEIPTLLNSLAAHPEPMRPSLSGVFTHQKKDGTRIEVEIASSMIDFFGRPAGLVLATDVTERRRMEQQFLRAQRMESIGTLAGGIAHDLNNLLMPIMMGVALLKRDKPSEAAARALENIERSARRGKDLVRQVLSFARGVEGSRVPVQIGDIVREVRSIAESTFPKSISTEIDVPKDLWWIDADPTQMNQVLLNLCVNARDAMPGGGRLAISARNVEIDEHYAGMDHTLAAGRYVMIEVADEGSGIPPEVLDRVFEPFFTTKEIGRGTGLGLSTVSAIVKAHGGAINVYSEVGQGTAFKIHLPAQKEGEDEQSVEEILPGELPRGNGETILIVDDEPSIVAITQQTLEAFGYKVLIAEDGAQAIGLWATHRKDIAAVITDMMMPVMDGPALIAALRRMDPDVKIIASSGLNDDRNAFRAAQVGVHDFLHKPYTAETLLETLHRVITA